MRISHFGSDGTFISILLSEKENMNVLFFFIYKSYKYFTGILLIDSKHAFLQPATLAANVKAVFTCLLDQVSCLLNPVFC